MVSEILKRMIEFSNGNRHDVEHFLKVWAYARAIGVREGLSGETLEGLELAAVVHDIACPLCREKYGDTSGAHQEAEGRFLARAFLADAGLDGALLERVVWLVGHHHTPEAVDGPDLQILLEADYLVNAGESGFSAQDIRRARGRVFRTETGTALLDAVYGAV